MKRHNIFAKVVIGVAIALIGVFVYTKTYEATPLIVETIDDQNYARIGYGSGWWSHQTGVYNSMWNTISYTNVLYNDVVFNFTGSKISYFYTMAHNRGLAGVYIDNQFYDALDTYSPQIRRQIGKTWILPYGNHTIRVVQEGP